MLHVFAALNVAKGKVKTEITKQKKRTDFQAFLDKLVQDIAPDQDIHILFANYCTHKKNDDWLKRHPNFFLFHSNIGKLAKSSRNLVWNFIKEAA